MKLTTLSLALMLSIGVSSPALAADAKKSKSDKKDTSLASMIKEKEETKGLFNFYQDKKSGEMLMVLNDDQLDTPILHFAHTVDGLLDAGHFRGGYRGVKIIEFRRYFNRIDIITKTPRFLFDENNPISRAKDANISEAVLASLPIKKEEDGKILLNVNKLFLGESLHRVSPWPSSGKAAAKRFSVGKLDSKKSRFLDKRAFDDNVDLVIDYVFSNPNPRVGGSRAVSDPRSTSVKVQHSFVKLPESDFKPRYDDARVGYFTHQYDEMTSTKWAPYKDVIKRWNLVKKDPSAELSEPVEPIVWWIENTTPLEWRDTIKEAVLSWNSSFEKAGFKNAIVVKIQPDDAEWSAGDINYNVLRWTSSPNPPFGGYGPSLANPLTGEMLGADIMLEYVFMKNRWIYDSLYSQGAASLSVAGHDVEKEGLHCSSGHLLQQSMIMANTITDTNSVEGKQLLDEGLRWLILHEVGHTLGLNHNMKASILWNEKDIHDINKTKGILAGSVMDYTAVNVAPKGMSQGNFFQTKPGPYDDWAIEFGYTTALEDEAAEAKRLAAILNRSSEHGHAFGNDADDMRRPGSHIDPRVMIGDMSSDPVAYASQRMELIDGMFSNLKNKTLKEGASYQPLLISANSLFGQYRTQAGIVSRQIGGVYVERDFHSKDNKHTPYTPVPKPTQKAAMNTLAKQVFNSDVLESMAPLYNYMQLQRRGFNHGGRNEDPRAHDMIIGMQRNVLAHLMHPNVLKRISDTSLYGNEYSLTEVMTDLTAAIFNSGKLTTVSQNIQTDYVKRLIAIVGVSKPSRYDNLARAAALGQLNAIYDNVSGFGFGQDAVTKDHNAYIALLIKNAIHS